MKQSVGNHVSIHGSEVGANSSIDVIATCIIKPAILESFMNQFIQFRHSGWGGISSGKADIAFEKAEKYGFLLMFGNILVKHLVGWLVGGWKCDFRSIGNWRGLAGVEAGCLFCQALRQSLTETQSASRNHRGVVAKSFQYALAKFTGRVAYREQSIVGGQHRNHLVGIEADVLAEDDWQVGGDGFFQSGDHRRFVSLGVDFDDRRRLEAGLTNKIVSRAAGDCAGAAGPVGGVGLQGGLRGLSA